MGLGGKPGFFTVQTADFDNFGEKKLCADHRLTPTKPDPQLLPGF